MKNLIIVSILLMVSVSGFAMNLTCVVHNRIVTEDSVSSFEIYNVENNETLESSLPDQGVLTPFEMVGFQATASFSNECDNMYDVSFSTAQFTSLLKGEKMTISGKMDYGVMDSDIQHARIQCKIK